jgi:DNA-directed RNA polymerase specialized sigma24 family protein
MPQSNQHRTPWVELDGDRLINALSELRDELARTLLFVLGHREDAPDAAQHALAKRWVARGHLSEVQYLRAWIIRVCRNTAKNMPLSAWKRRVRALRGEELML